MAPKVSKSEKAAVRIESTFTAYLSLAQHSRYIIIDIERVSNSQLRAQCLDPVRPCFLS